MDLVVGATGVLGGEITRALAAQGRRVRALARPTSDPRRVEALRHAGVEILLADLKRPDELPPLCAGVDTLVSTASSTLSRQEGDSIDSVDLKGQLHLLDAALSTGVRHLVFISFPPADISFPLQDAKREVEGAIRASGIGYSILQPTHFLEIWCSPALGLDAAAGKARLFGDGTGKMSWISLLDVRDAAVAAVDNPSALGETFQLGGPELLSQDAIVRRFESATARSFERESVPFSVLREGYEAATDPLQKSFAALSLICGRGGWNIDMTQTIDILPYAQRSVDAFVRDRVKQIGSRP